MRNSLKHLFPPATFAAVLVALLACTAAADGFVTGRLDLKFRSHGGPSAFTRAGSSRVMSGDNSTVLRTFADSAWTSHSASWADGVNLLALADTTAWQRFMPADWYPQALCPVVSTGDDSCWVGTLYLMPDGSNPGMSLVASMDTVRVTVQYSYDDDDYAGTVGTTSTYVFQGAGVGVVGTKAWSRAIYFSRPASLVGSIATFGLIAHVPKWRVIFQGDYTGRYRAFLEYPRNPEFQTATAKPAKR